jgi:tripartite-type tricarboxylate transporter receptor subunit TctC
MGDTATTRQFARLVSVFVLLLLPLWTPAEAQTYPSRAIHIIVTSGAGGFTDLIARFYGQKLAERTGQSVAVENVTGAAGLLATDRVAKSAPDGYTLLVASPGPVAVGPYLRTAPYDPLKDLTAVAFLATTPTAFAVNSSLLPVRSFQEFIAYAKARPGQISYSSPGYGSLMHLGGELLRVMAGIEIVHVPYRGTVPGMAALVAGDVQAGFGDLPALFAQTQSDAAKVRILALVDPMRSTFTPDVPTVAECCLPGYDASGWGMLLGPAGLPKDVIAFLNGEARAIFDLPDVRLAMQRAVIEPAVLPPDKSAAFLKEQNEKWSKVIRDAKITLKQD